jgi:Ca2+-binding RTX toxin-like protein
VCTALALTLASTIPALAYGNTSNNLSLQLQDPCAAPGVIHDDDNDHYLKGTNGADTICGTPERDVIEALGGDDIIYGLGGNDTMEGGPGNDTIFGGDGDDDVEGEGGSDTIYGGLGADTMLGHPSNDTIYANEYPNITDNAIDTINGGGGNNDTCYYTGEDVPKVTNCEVIHNP